MEREKQQKINEKSMRICKIREKFCYGNNIDFAQKIGVSTTQASNLCGGKFSIGDKSIEKILNAFPEVSKDWLVLGEGPMLRQDIHQNEQTGMNVGGDNIVGGSSKTTSEGLDTLIATNAKLAATLQQQADQIGKLIEMLNRQ